jgi:hypothetical protein
MLVCKICGFSRPISISSKHIKSHGISVQEYKGMYPEARLRIQTEETKRKMSLTKMGKPSPLLGKPKTAEHIRNQKASLKLSYETGKIVHWNIGNTTPENVKEKIAAGNRGGNNKGNIKQRLKKQERIRNGATAFNCVILSIDDIPGTATAKCLECTHTFTFTHQVFYENRLNATGKLCPACQPRSTFSSAGEREVLEFIKNKYPKEVVLSNDRAVLGGKELDVYLPNKKIGFEYTGLYWHAEKQNLSNKHLLWKRDFCFNHGIELITIFEDEWVQKKEIVQSMIASSIERKKIKKLKIESTVEQISLAEKNLFLNQHHILGA